MFTNRARFASFFAALMLCSAVSALAEDMPELPPLAQPGQWLYVTQEDRTSSSQCVGQPGTPLCAVETLLACFQRDRQDLCRMVDDGTEQYAQIFNAPADPAKYLAYRVLGAHRIDADSPRVGQASHAKDGDVLLTVDQREGLLGRYARATGAPAQDFLLRRQPDGAWKIVSWGDPGESLSAAP
jgi:hypothetical protein